MEQVARAVWTACIAAALSSCGINALRGEYARDVTTEGSTIAASSSQFLHSVEVSRRLANIEMVVADPACAGPPPTEIRQVPQLDRRGPGWLCLLPGEPKGHRESQFSLRPISATDLQPTILMISALDSYINAVADIVDAKPSDPMKPLLDALATARSAQGLLGAVTGAKGPAIPGADDKRVQAVSDFVGFLSQLSDEADQVRRLRQFIAANPSGAAPLIEALQSHLSTWEISRKGDDGLRLVVTGSELRRTLDANPPVAPEARRQALTNYYAVQDAVGATDDIYPALSNALSDLREADANLRRVIVDAPRLTAAEREKVAETNRRRAMKAMDTVAALVTSFKGV